MKSIKIDIAILFSKHISKIIRERQAQFEIGKFSKALHFLDISSV